jgi:hypothetical protein
MKRRGDKSGETENLFEAGSLKIQYRKVSLSHRRHRIPDLRPNTRVPHKSDLVCRPLSTHQARLFMFTALRVMV